MVEVPLLHGRPALNPGALPLANPCKEDNKRILDNITEVPRGMESSKVRSFLPSVVGSPWRVVLSSRSSR